MSTLEDFLFKFKDGEICYSTLENYILESFMEKRCSWCKNKLYLCNIIPNSTYNCCSASCYKKYNNSTPLVDQLRKGEITAEQFCSLIKQLK
jgi:hypothetical protein